MKARGASANDAWNTITDHAPVAHRLKSQISDRWVRFYSLPQAKRYATDQAEQQVVLDRADALLRATIGYHSRVLVVSGHHGARTAPELSPSQATIHTTPEHWYTEPDSDIDDPDWPLHLWSSWEVCSSGSFGSLIALTADSKLIEVMLVSAQKGVVLHPYDGGMDIFMRTSVERDDLRAQFAQWASPLPSGL